MTTARHSGGTTRARRRGEHGAENGADDRGDADELDLVDRVLGLGHDLHALIEKTARRHDLTAPQALLLRRLDQPVSMRVLAEGLSCDPSNVTGLIDRIEHLGLVERTVDANDRRVRLLALTASGRRLKNRLERELVGEGSPLRRMSREELGRLATLLRAFGPR